MSEVPIKNLIFKLPRVNNPKLASDYKRSVSRV